MSDKEGIKKEYSTQTAKLVYYIIALCITAIGFSVSRTVEKPLCHSHIPLGIAVVFWGISVFVGFAFIKSRLRILYGNFIYLEILEGNIEEFNKTQSHQEYAAELALKDINKNSKKYEKHIFLQEILFYLGIISFIIWHIIEMYNNSNI